MTNRSRTRSVRLAALGCLLVVLAESPGLPEPERPPRAGSEWRTLIASLEEAFSRRDYQSMVIREPPVREAVLAPATRQYLPAIYFALAFHRLGRPAESVPYYQKALEVRFKPEHLRSYGTVMAGLHRADEGLRWMLRLQAQQPAAEIRSEADRLAFFAEVEAGDERYLAGDRGGALIRYQDARRRYDALPNDLAARQAEQLEPLKKVWHEYTYYHAYDAPDGMKRRELLVESFLTAKLRLCLPAPPVRNAVKLRAAALVVRGTDVEFLDGDRKVRERNRLADEELARQKQAWQFAADALKCYSGGQVELETTYHDLPSATLTGLDDHIWKGLVHVRHLDPAMITPPQDELFKQVSEQADAVIFLWPRGRAARAYGGGPLALPYRKGLLPARAGIKSMPATSTLCLHELLHSFQEPLRLPPVHGPREPWAKVARDHRLGDELDWYLHLIASVRDWSPATFRNRTIKSGSPVD